MSGEAKRGIGLVGLTGSLAAGKSTAAQILADEGFQVVDADQIAKKLLTEDEVRTRIIASLGADCYDGSKPDHAAIAKKVFSDASKRKELESIIHPLVRQRIKQLSQTYRPLIYDVPLLFETGAHKETDLNVMIDAPLELRMQRANNRNQWSPQQFMVRENSQMPASQKREMADIVIDNDGDQSQLRNRLQGLIERLKS